MVTSIHRFEMRENLSTPSKGICYAQHFVDKVNDSNCMVQRQSPILPNLAETLDPSRKIMHATTVTTKAHNKTFRFQNICIAIESNTSSMHQLPDSKIQDFDEFLLPDLNELQGTLSTSRAGHEEIHSLCTKESSIDFSEIPEFPPKSTVDQLRLGWHSELTLAFDTLSAFEIVDHGRIRDD